MLNNFLKYKNLRHKEEGPRDQMIILNSYFNADYQNGKIYHVTFDEHKLNPKSAVYKCCDDNPIIEVICG